MNPLDHLFVYHPEPWVERDWAKASGLPLEDVWFEAADGARLFGWYVESRQTPAVMLWCHGNAGNIIHRLQNLVELMRVVGLSVFLFDYRGYGRSQGRPSEEGLYRDALAAYRFLVTAKGVAPKRLVLFGRSLGAAVAGEVAARQPAAGLILESAFPSIEAVAKAHYGGLPVHWLLGADYRVLDRLPYLTLPKLIVHGDRDEIVPLALGRQVFEAAREPKQFYLVTGADHNDVPFVGGRPYFLALKAFIASVVR